MNSVNANIVIFLCFESKFSRQPYFSASRSSDGGEWVKLKSRNSYSMRERGGTIETEALYFHPSPLSCKKRRAENENHRSKIAQWATNWLGLNNDMNQTRSLTALADLIKDLPTMFPGWVSIQTKILAISEQEGENWGTRLRWLTRAFRR